MSCFVATNININILIVTMFYIEVICFGDVSLLYADISGTKNMQSDLLKITFKKGLFI